MREASRAWLVKSEAEDFSIDDLAREGRVPWTGIRNYQARNFMRDEMKGGDPVLFYHTGTGNSEVVGIARVHGSPYADPTQFEPESPYFDARSTPENPRWWLVDLEFVEKLPRPLPIAELRKHPGLRDMALLNRPRLSVQPVSPAEFEIVRAMAQ